MNIGIIGGLGPLSTSVAISKISERCLAKYGFLPNLTIQCVNGLKFLSMAYDRDDLLSFIAGEIDKINDISDVIVIFCNSAHLISEDLEKMYPGKFFNLVSQACRLLEAECINQKIGLVGTSLTINNHFYNNEENSNILWAIPDQSTQHDLDKFLFSSKNIFCSSDNRKQIQPLIQKISENFIAQNCTHLLLACTELDEFIKGMELGINLISSRELFIDSIVNKLSSE